MVPRGGKDKDEAKYTMCRDKYESDGVLVGWENMGSYLGQEQSLLSYQANLCAVLPFASWAG